MSTQKCPSCGALVDVSIFVSGKRVLCDVCKVPFFVQRAESMVVDPAEPARDARRQRRPAGLAGGGVAVAPVPGRARPILRPHPAVEQQEAAERARPRIEERLEPAPPAAAPVPSAPAAPAPAARPADRDTQPVADGVAIPGFELFEVIGKGGMGKVYRAKQLSLGRLVAIKVLNEDLAKHKSFIRRFEKETASLAALRHSNISHIIDRGNHGDVWFFVMEYIEGPSLRQSINRGRMELAEVLEVCKTLCRAVGHAHQRGVIHRDLKPENVLFTADGELKVVDFGLANILDEERRWSMTRTKVSMGTVNYMAPEQRRDAKNVDQRADIYSLGVMMYELLAGELPLGRFDPPSRHRPEVNSRLDSLVLKMLDFDPDERPQKLEHVLATLEGVPAPGVDPTPGLVEAPVARDQPPVGPLPASRSSLGPVLHRSRRPRRLSASLLLGLGGLVVLAVGAVVVFAVLLRSDLADGEADLVVSLEEGAPKVNLVHPQQIMHLPPQSSGDRAGRQVVRFDFRASRLPTVPVRLVGGDWTWQDRAGLLVQDTSRSALTINQRPTTASFGEPRPAEGVRLSATVEADASRFDPGGGPTPMQRLLAERLAEVRVLAQVESADRVGLGFVNERGDGLIVLLPVLGGGTGLVVRRGPGMERESSTFGFPEAQVLAGQRQQLRLELVDGRLTFWLGDRQLVDELAGLPLRFGGTPALACQNARCAFVELEYSR